jgi:hypothetical protein
MSLFQLVSDFVKGKPAFTRSSKWRELRNEFLVKHPFCALCGSKDKLEVHHLTPVHINPSAELDADNLITLCEVKKWGVNCHLFLGHCGNYRDYNPTLKSHIQMLRPGFKGQLGQYRVTCYNARENVYSSANVWTLFHLSDDIFKQAVDEINSRPNHNPVPISFWQLKQIERLS